MRFIGTKIVTAEPMTRAAYVAFRGWVIPFGEDPNDQGYLVEYEPDGKPNVPGRAGYVTWTPKGAFDGAYRPCTEMTFGLALDSIKRGAKVARTGWNGKNMWLALSGSTTQPRNIAHENFWSKNASEWARTENGGGAEVLPCILMKTADSRILMGWLASQTDMLAEDWLIVE